MEPNVAAADPSAVRRRAAARAFPGADVRTAPAEELPWPDGAFDAALAQLVVALHRRRAGRHRRDGAGRRGPAASSRPCMWDSRAGWTCSLATSGEVAPRARPPRRRGERQLSRRSKRSKTLWSRGGLEEVEAVPTRRLDALRELRRALGLVELGVAARRARTYGALPAETRDGVQGRVLRAPRRARGRVRPRRLRPGRVRGRLRARSRLRRRLDQLRPRSPARSSSSVAASDGRRIEMTARSRACRRRGARPGQVGPASRPSAGARCYAPAAEVVLPARGPEARQAALSRWSQLSSEPRRSKHPRSRPLDEALRGPVQSRPRAGSAGRPARSPVEHLGGDRRRRWS